MTITDVADALPWMDDKARIWVAVERKDFELAMEMARGGPEILSTQQAAQLFGWDSRRWREWAQDPARIPGAFIDNYGHYRLPRDECRTLKERMERDGRAPPRRANKKADLTSDSRALARVTTHANVNPDNWSFRRGPRGEAVD